MNAARGEADGYEPTIWISTRKDAAEIEIAVRDNGPGIDEAILDKVMTPFFTTKPPNVGVGLGLSQCADAARQHSGTIGIEARPGTGTTVRIRLPAEGAGRDAHDPRRGSQAHAGVRPQSERLPEQRTPKRLPVGPETHQAIRAGAVRPARGSVGQGADQALREGAEASGTHQETLSRTPRCMSRFGRPEGPGGSVLTCLPSKSRPAAARRPVAARSPSRRLRRLWRERPTLGHSTTRSRIRLRAGRVQDELGAGDKSARRQTSGARVGVGSGSTSGATLRAL